VPNGEHVLTSAELIANFNGEIMADTFVWQRTSNVGNNTGNGNNTNSKNQNNTGSSNNTSSGNRLPQTGALMTNTTAAGLGLAIAGATAAYIKNKKK
jgi:LPXTG-motif cell wall-anchored protein